MHFDEFCQYIKSMDGNISIGVHGIKEEPKDEITAQIMENGLELHGWGGLLSSVQMFGQIKNLGMQDLKDLYDYAYNNTGSVTNILFGFPEMITNNNGEDFYLGHFNPIKGYAKGNTDAGSDLPLNKLFEKTKVIPKEFVIASLTTKDNVSKLISNPNFYGLNNHQAFDDMLFTALTDQQIISGQVYYNNKELFAKFGYNKTLLLSQYEEYLEENKQK